MKNNRIKWILGGCALPFMLYACSGGAEKRWEIERDSLMQINRNQYEVLNEMTSAIMEISNILDTINMQEHILFSRYDMEGRRYTRAQVVENLKTFEEILQEKRMRIHYLDSLMNKNDKRIRQLSSLVRYLNLELDKKDSIIQVLKADVQRKDLNIKTLNERIGTINADMAMLSDSLSVVNEKSSGMEDVIKQQEEELYAVYYIIGTKRELKAKKVLTDGGLFKRGKIDMTAVSVAEKADSRELSVIKIYGKKPSVLTELPEDSYSLIRISDEIYELKILDKKLFWSHGKLLVIQVK